jgi:hypothetical protein
VIRWCFVVLLGGFATDIPRAWLLKINDFQTSKFPNLLSLRASNQVVGGSNPSGRALNIRVHSGHMGNVLYRTHFSTEGIWGAFDATCLVIKEPQVVVHKTN